MTVYFESSALVAVYVTEAYSGAARAELRKHVSVPWTPLHDLEVRNALRLLRGRGKISEGELRGLLQHVDDDLTKGRLARHGVDLEAVFRRGVELSHRHASKTLARTLDILHVAALIEIGCTSLVSGDERQIALAKTEGLSAVDIRARARRSS
jgi:predicted nucleic acid-binding protein